MTSQNNQCREVQCSPEALCEAELDAVTGGSMMELMAQMLSNLANMRHEMLKAVANNLRG